MVAMMADSWVREWVCERVAKWDRHWAAPSVSKTVDRTGTKWAPQTAISMVGLLVALWVTERAAPRGMQWAGPRG